MPWAQGTTTRVATLGQDKAPCNTPAAPAWPGAGTASVVSFKASPAFLEEEEVAWC